MGGFKHSSRCRGRRRQPGADPCVLADKSLPRTEFPMKTSLLIATAGLLAASLAVAQTAAPQ